MAQLRTERLLLRQWEDADLAPFAALNADAAVMRYFPSPLTREQSDALARRARTTIAHHGWGLWAVESISSGSFIGFVGLARPGFDAHFTPAVEVGWRLARPCWGNGYATEAAGASVAFGFQELGLDEIVSFTAVVNERSQRVMTRLGMSHDPDDDFDHPMLRGPLGRHVLFRLPRSAWQARAASGASF